MSHSKAQQNTAISQLYQHNHQWLRNWLLSLISCPELASDLTQDTFVRLLLKVDNLTIKEPRAYLTTIAKGLVIDQWRRSDIEKAYHEALSHQDEHTEISTEDLHLTLELLTQISEMLDGLKANVRKAFLLSQLEGMTYAGIARDMGVSTRTIERYMAQAMMHCYQLRYGAFS